MFELVARAKAPQLDLNHRAEVSGCVVMELEHFAQVTVVDDNHASS